jgi:uracil-DNA glycosylase
MPNTWKALIAEESAKDYYKELKAFVDDEYASRTIYPPRKCILHALELTPLRNVKVVILGQDPYHEAGQAMGLSFSVPDGIALPPSLENIFKEIAREYGCAKPTNGDLSRWAKQGVLLLNTVLTVRAHEANSHAGHGWERLTDEIIKCVAEREQPAVFLLWGRSAQVKADNIIKKYGSGKHLVLQTSHPSPLSVYRGFDGCDHFKKANEFLTRNGIEPIRWEGN